MSEWIQQHKIYSLYSNLINQSSKIIKQTNFKFLHFLLNNNHSVIIKTAIILILRLNYILNNNKIYNKVENSHPYNLLN